MFCRSNAKIDPGDQTANLAQGGTAGMWKGGEAGNGVAGLDRQPPWAMAAALRLPLVQLVGLLLLVALAASGVLALRLAQPAIGPGLVSVTYGQGAGLRGPDGSALPLLAVLPVAGTAAPPLPVTPELVIEDPDMLGSYAVRRQFFAAQDRLMAMARQALAADRPLRGLVAGPDGQTRLVALPVTARSRAADLPASFWVQLGCGTVILAIAAAFLALRAGRGSGPDGAAAPEGLGGFVLAGLGAGVSAFTAALYSSRGLAMDGTVLLRASVGNHLFALLFGLGLIALFARYPRPVLARRWLVLAAVAFGVQALAYRMELLPHAAANLQLAVGLLFAGILALVVAQHRATRGNPADRAALRWLGFSTVLGSGVFVALVALPVALQQNSVMSQGMAFLPLCAIYLGTALAFARYRLFDLDRWALRILFHLGVVALLVAVDIAVLVTLSLSGPASMASAVALVGLAYFPLRDLVFDRLSAGHRPDLAAIHAGAVNVAFQIDPAAKAEAWGNLLKRLFAPLQAGPAGRAVAAPAIADEGLALLIPAQGGAPALRLGHAGDGRRLFHAADVALAAQVLHLVQAAEADRAAYEAALHQERRRIARDLHDDVGASLLSALHAGSGAQRQDFLLDALADLRQIATGLAGRPVTLEAQIAEMRAESRNRAEARGCTLDWPLGSADDAAQLLSYATRRNLTALHREALSNALAHGAGGPIRIRADHDGSMLRYLMENPLRDTRPETGGGPHRGAGSGNMRSRADAMGARLHSAADPARGVWRLELDLPLAADAAPEPGPEPGPEPEPAR